MPLSKYYGGHGKKVMSHMKKQYGEEKGESVFYATANKKKKHEKYEKSESRKEEKLEAGPSSKVRRKHGV